MSTDDDPRFLNLHRQMLKLEQKLEHTSVESPRRGYALNMYGGYDRQELVEALSTLCAEISRIAPHDNDISFRCAGVLARARRYEEAREIYARISMHFRPALVMLAMIEAELGNLKAAQDHVDTYNRRCVAEGIPLLQTSLDKVRLHKAL